MACTDFTSVAFVFYSFFFFFNDTATTEIYTLSLHDALPISRQDTCRTPVPATCGNHCRASARHCSSLTGGPPGAIPAASAGATYLRTVLASTPRLRATSTFGRPAYQCSKISVTSTIVNVLLAISVLRPEADERHTQLEGPGTEPSAPPAPRETLIEEVGNYLIAAGTRLGNFVIVSTRTTHPPAATG